MTARSNRHHVFLVNSATIIGHVGQDAEFKEVKDRTVVNFTMATNENRKDAEGKRAVPMGTVKSCSTAEALCERY